MKLIFIGHSLNAIIKFLVLNEPAGYQILFLIPIKQVGKETSNQQIN